MSAKKPNPTWIDVKTKLSNFDQVGLINLVQDLYAASMDTRTFLHVRLRLGGDALAPYKASIDRWLWPDVLQQQDTSVAKAKKAIADYKMASGTADGLAELMVFYCEQASGFSNDVSLDDESYFEALIRMFGQALKVIDTLPQTQRPALLARLDAVRQISHDIGYGVGEDMDSLLDEHGGYG
jgi:hypothetical protein